MSEKKMRITAHNGRAGKDGVYSSKHNDRNFNIENSPHIDGDQSEHNWYWHCYKKNKPGMTFEEVEKLFYEYHFREILDERNTHAIKVRHPERVKTMDDYRVSKKSCPEEQIIQIGQRDNTIPPELLHKICIAQIQWEHKRFPNFKLINVALHVDEEGAPHMHKRGVWIAHDDKGREIVGQTKALNEMGILPPDPEKKVGKYNNAKMTYSKECREHLAEVCRMHGLDLELNPKERSKTGLALEEYKARQEEERALKIQCELKYLQEQIVQKEYERVNVEERLKDAQNALLEIQTALESLLEQREKLAVLKHQITVAQEELKITLGMKARASEIRKVFGNKDIVTYHRGMLEQTRSIGDIASEHLREASEKLIEIAGRERELNKKENAIESLYVAAQADREQARDYLDCQRSYILGTSNQIFNEFIKGFEMSGQNRNERLEVFCKQYWIDGERTILDIFNEEEQELRKQLLREWDEQER